jgi:hypothetical protein
MAEQNPVTMDDDDNNITALEQPAMAVTDAEPSAELALNEHTNAIEPLEIEEPKAQVRSKLRLYALLTSLYARHFV